MDANREGFEVPLSGGAGVVASRLREAQNVRFRDAYTRLSEVGMCDSPGGAEYMRVREDWVVAKRPGDVARFIYTRANIGPDGQEPTPEAIMDAMRRLSGNV